jgi:hypothetical protein
MSLFQTAKQITCAWKALRNRFHCRQCRNAQDTLLTEERFHEIDPRLEESPSKSLAQFALQRACLHHQHKNQQNFWIFTYVSQWCLTTLRNIVNQECILWTCTFMECRLEKTQAHSHYSYSYSYYFIIKLDFTLVHTSALGMNGTGLQKIPW